MRHFELLCGANRLIAPYKLFLWRDMAKCAIMLTMPKRIPEKELEAVLQAVARFPESVSIDQLTSSFEQCDLQSACIAFGKSPP
jgi:hypothetical protein